MNRRYGNEEKLTVGEKHKMLLLNKFPYKKSKIYALFVVKSVPARYTILNTLAVN